MAMEKALALVVRGMDWSETSRITTLWTREFGKVRALAKGGRRLRSNFEVAFDLLTVCHVVVIRKHTGGLDLLTEAQVAERFPGLRADLPALYVGYYVAELLADGTQDYDPHPVLFDEAIATLRGLGGQALPTPEPPLPQRGEGGQEVVALSSHPLAGTREGRGSRAEGEGPSHASRASAFELAWLRELGYSPRLDTCAACDADLTGRSPPAGRIGYSPSAGGVLCGACRTTVRDHRLLSGEALAVLRALARGEPALPADVRMEVRHVLGQTVSAVLGRRPRLLGYVDGG